MSDARAAELRLAASRERLRLALEAAAPKRGLGAAGVGADWLSGLESIPGLGVVVEALRAWWSQHPLRTTAMLITEAARTIVQPLAQKHPLGLMLAGAFAGAVMVLTRPWRWVTQPALLAGLMPQIVNKVLAQVPLQTWLEALAAFAGPRATAPEPAATSEPTPPAQPQHPDSGFPGL